jgi:hypothetical protein
LRGIFSFVRCDSERKQPPGWAFIAVLGVRKAEVLIAIGASLYPMNGAIALSVAEPTRSPGSYFSGGRIS